MVPWVWFDNLGMGEKIALLLISCSMSSYAAMNFTGATPFTSPSGVEKEMRRGIPVQGAAVLAALILWVRGGFL
jgi:phosphatidylserine synthase